MNDSTTTTATQATNGIMADSQQTLTSPVPTSLQVTPTLTFGDIGTVIETKTEGHPCRLHGVGELPDPYLLERMVKMPNVIWTVDDITGTLESVDIDAFLRGYPRNKDILDLYRAYHTDYEVTIKLNTNQFYQGAIAVTLIPDTGSGFLPPTGDTLAERMVQDPTVLSAATAESIVKTWSWAWPQPWQPLHVNGVDKHRLMLQIDGLLPLRTAKADMSEELDIQIWVRFKNIKLMYPFGPSSDPQARSQAQSHRGGAPQVAVPRGHRVSHPAQDPLSGLTDTATNIVNSVVSAPAQIADGLIGAADSFLSQGLAGIVGGLFDKPDQVDEPTTVVIDSSKDLLNCDIPSQMTNVGLYKSRYLDPSPSRMPGAKPGGFTLLDFAKIPGLLQVHEFSGTLAPHLDLDLIKAVCPFDQLRTPLEYATKCCHLSRGSVKLCLQFFTSSFVSARFVVQLKRKETGLGFDDDYDWGLAKVINVKGDTVDTMTIPWIDYVWWRDIDLRQIRIKLVSGMVSTDVTTDPKIGLLVWAAAADDYQFAFPRLPSQDDWQPESTLSQAQAAIGQLFQTDFPAIVADVFYDTDQGYCNNEAISHVTDLAKRFACMNTEPVPLWNPLTLDVNVLDTVPVKNPTEIWNEYAAFRRTFFGAMRAMFMFRSGGYAYRAYRLSEGDLIWKVRGDGRSTTRDLSGTIYPHPFDSVARLIVPQLASTPYLMLNNDNDDETPDYGLSLIGTPVLSDQHLVFLAARDDVQFGYPILPQGVPAFDSSLSSLKASKTVTSSTEIRLEKRRSIGKDNKK